MADPTTPATSRAAAEAAERYVFESLGRELDQAGTPEAVLHLRHLVRARFVSVQPEGRLRRVQLHMQHRVSEYSVQLNAVTGEQTGWYFSALSRDSADGLPAEEALAIATKVAGTLDNAVLQHSGYEQQGEHPVFIARWAHHEQGIPVERDYVHVQVNGATGRAFGVRRRWHALETKATWR